MSNVAVIGSGFSGLAAACFAAKQQHHVTLFEKNNTIGGRARAYTEHGFTFDMGPSWYWMPDVFETFFNYFDKSVSDYYSLTKLDPGFQIIFGEEDVLKVPASVEELYAIFESIEKGSAKKLEKFLVEGALKYRVGMQQFIHKPSLSWLEFFRYDILSNIGRVHIFTSFKKYVRSFFKDERLIALLEFPVLFLGAMPAQIPALYSLMNYAAFSLGTWYPMGGMYKILEAMHQLALSLDVQFNLNTSVEHISIANKKAQQIKTTEGNFNVDAVIASADYHHVEQHLLEPQYRNYDEAYWAKKVFAPSCLIYYLGVNKKIKNLIHHNLFFDTGFNEHAKNIYEQPQWPTNPLFYTCCPSKTDNSVAPEGMENLFVLIPIAAGIEDTVDHRKHYLSLVMKRMETFCGESILPHIIYQKSYCVNDFATDYHAYKGNAYGLANTLKQTAVLKPSIRNKKIKNVFYTGQLTVPGPGVPPALISGQIAVAQAVKYFKSIR